ARFSVPCRHSCRHLPTVHRHECRCGTLKRAPHGTIDYMRFLLVVLTVAGAFAQPATDLEAVVSTELGTFRLEFAPDKAPKHVEQFLARAPGLLRRQRVLSR